MGTSRPTSRWPVPRHPRRQARTRGSARVKKSKKEEEGGEKVSLGLLARLGSSRENEGVEKPLDAILLDAERAATGRVDGAGFDELAAPGAHHVLGEPRGLRQLR